MTYVAYFLIFIACSVSATFTVFYGLTFGKAKSEAWISAMMISFWQDVLVSQPLKVFAAATLFAVLTKDPKKATGEDQEETLPSPELQEDEEFTGQSMEGRGMSLFASFFLEKL
jgi:polycystin 1L2